MLTSIPLLLMSMCISSIYAAPLFADKYHPIVIWHGLGDSAYSEGMVSLASELREAFPGIYVHLVSLTEDLTSDQKAGFLGNVNLQIEQVCQDLDQVKELKNGFDAIGFSQGGQFLRGYVERCNRPAVRNLVTFGSQHMGISDLPACKPGDFLCRLAEGALRGGIYTDYAQTNVITAQYFRDPTKMLNYEKYLESNKFLPDINNEVARNQTYKRRLMSLDSLVLLMFDKDITVEPKQSSWFASYPVDDGEKDASTEVIPLRQSSIYKEDWIGLKTLDKRGSLVLDLCHGVHMQIDAACQMKVFGKYVGIAPPSSLMPTTIRHAWSRAVYTMTGLRMSATPTSLQLLLLLFTILAAQTVFRGTQLLLRKRQQYQSVRLV
ncbi:hypothetical protein CBS101457_000473 [Exobasidium rhododendri]|nr:hypothetical protein CBS101457_000473 [Exobasidium rhododendri]